MSCDHLDGNEDPSSDGEEGRRTPIASDELNTASAASPESIAFEPRARASYIAALTAELAAIARDGQLHFLAQLLEIAQLEASNTERRIAPGRSSG